MLLMLNCKGIFNTLHGDEMVTQKNSSCHSNRTCAISSLSIYTAQTSQFIGYDDIHMPTVTTWYAAPSGHKKKLFYPTLYSS